MNDYARQLHTARKTTSPIEQLTASGAALTRSDAYKIQENGINFREEDGEKIIGMKMGLTSEAKRLQMNLDAPLYGVLTDKMEVKNNGEFSLEKMIHCKAEPEIAFCFNKELVPGMSYEEMFEAMEWIAPAIEILDSRYKQFKYFSMEDVISDNSSSSHFIIGEKKTSFTKDDYYHLPMKFFVNDEIVHEGSSNNISDDPLNSIVELCSLMKLRDKTLPAEILVLAGAATAAVALEVGMKIKLVVERHGETTFTVKE